MPDPITHYVFGQELRSRLDNTVLENIDTAVFSRALQGADPWSTIGFYGAENKQYSVRSNIMHKEKTGLFLLELTLSVRKNPCVEGFSLLAGFLCHYCLDKTCHPYIIAKSGDCDGTKETLHLRSSHVRLERAIDSYYIRKYYNKKPWHFSLPKNIFTLKEYPECLKKTIDEVFFKVYGFADAFNLFNKALKDEALFYGLMQDRFGLAHYLLRLVSNKNTNFALFSYYKRETDSEKIDYLNLKNSVWLHPYDSSQEHRENFEQLFEQALNQAEEMINGAYKYVFGGEDLPLDKLYGNASYCTGFDCFDARNDSKPCYQPIIYKHKYWNN